MSASARDLILFNATSPVNSCHFCHCGFQPLSWVCPGGGRGVGCRESWGLVGGRLERGVGGVEARRGGRLSTGRHDLSQSCTLLNHPTRCSPTWRVGVKLLTCDM